MPIIKTLNEFLAFFSLTQKEKMTVFRTLRSGLYLFLLIFLILGIWMLAKYCKKTTFMEYGPIESIQLTTLILTTFLFLLHATKNYHFKPISLFLASLTTFCCVRELDTFFENLIPIISWKFAWFFPLWGTWIMFRNRKSLRKPLFIFLDSGAFNLMIIALIIFFPLAQCIGHRSFIADALGTSNNLIYIRRLIEESMEVMAYILIFLSSVEIGWVSSFNTKKGK